MGFKLVTPSFIDSGYSNLPQPNIKETTTNAIASTIRSIKQTKVYDANILDSNIVFLFIGDV